MTTYTYIEFIIIMQMIIISGINEKIMYLAALEMFFDSSNIGLNIPHACAQFVSLIFQLSREI